jgi:sec-independent protein translocase protein TatA
VSIGLKHLNPNHCLRKSNLTLENFVNAGIGAQEIIIIIVAAGILIFGAKKIPELAKTLGRSRMEYEKGKFEAEKEFKDLKEKKD